MRIRIQSRRTALQYQRAAPLFKFGLALELVCISLKPFSDSSKGSCLAMAFTNPPCGESRACFKTLGPTRPTCRDRTVRARPAGGSG